MDDKTFTANLLAALPHKEIYVVDLKSSDKAAVEAYKHFISEEKTMTIPWELNSHNVCRSWRNAIANLAITGKTIIDKDSHIILKFSESKPNEKFLNIAEIFNQNMNL